MLDQVAIHPNKGYINGFPIHSVRCGSVRSVHLITDIIHIVINGWPCICSLSSLNVHGLIMEM